MGQAKQRGTFEQRQAEGIAKQQAEAARRQAELELRRHDRMVQEIQRRRSMTPEQRKKERESRRLFLIMTALFSGMQ